MAFSKVALSIPDQLVRLEARGLSFPDVARAERYLSVIGYYRLSAYTRPFQQNLTTHQFHADVIFDDVLNLYIFDRQLRLLLLDALERVEVALRTRISDIMCDRTNDTHWYLNPVYFDAKYDHARLLKEVRDYKDDFVTSYHQKYTTPADVPAWMGMQALTFGAVQKVLLNLRKREKESICKSFGFEMIPMVTWVYAMTTLRNHAAHHARTWNRTFHVNLPIGAPVPKTMRAPIDNTNDNVLDGYALVLEMFMQHVSPSSHWWSRVCELIQNYYDATPHGFHKASLLHRARHLVKP